MRHARYGEGVIELVVGVYALRLAYEQALHEPAHVLGEDALHGPAEQVVELLREVQRAQRVPLRLPGGDEVRAQMRPARGVNIGRIAVFLRRVDEFERELHLVARPELGQSPAVVRDGDAEPGRAGFGELHGDGGVFVPVAVGVFEHPRAHRTRRVRIAGRRAHVNAGVRAVPDERERGEEAYEYAVPSAPLAQQGRPGGEGRYERRGRPEQPVPGQDVAREGAAAREGEASRCKCAHAPHLPSLKRRYANMIS